MNAIIYCGTNMNGLSLYMTARNFKSVDCTIDRLDQAITDTRNSGYRISCIIVVGNTITTTNIINIGNALQKGIPIIYSTQVSAPSPTLSIGIELGLYNSPETESKSLTGSTLLYGTPLATSTSFQFSGLSNGIATIIGGLTWQLYAPPPINRTSSLQLFGTLGSIDSGYDVIARVKTGHKSFKYDYMPATVFHAGFFFDKESTRDFEIFYDLVVLCDESLALRYISGFIKDENNNPISRKLRLYSKKSGALLTETISSTLDGSYTLTSVYDDEVSVVCLSEDSDTQNSKIADKIFMRIAV